MNCYVLWYSRIVWIGIAVNMLFVIPLAFVPSWFLGLLDITLDQPIWGQAAAMLLFIISVFYVPGAVDPIRYRATAWMHVFPSRTCGSTFFLTAVLFFNQPLGFLSIALVDAIFGLASLYCLMQMNGGEHAGGMEQDVEAEAKTRYPRWVLWLVIATISMLTILISGLALE